jgi:hypothetical protein
MRKIKVVLQTQLNDIKSKNMILWFVIIISCTYWTLTPNFTGTKAEEIWREEIILHVDTNQAATDEAHRACTPSPDDCSLPGAVTRANLDPLQHYTIMIPNGSYLLSGLILSGDILLVGSSNSNTIINAEYRKDPVFIISPQGQVEIQDLLIKHPAKWYTEGGGVNNKGNLKLLRCVVQDSQAGKGGGIFNEGILTIDDSIISDNKAYDGGGGIWNQPDGVIHIIDTKVENNICDAGEAGGGIHNKGSAVLRNSLIQYNYAGDGRSGSPGGHGGGIFNNGSMELINCQVKANRAGKGGNGEDAPGWIECGSGENGGPGGHGGGIYNLGSLEIAGSVISDNFAGTGGDGGKRNTLYPCGNVSGAGGDGGSGGGIYSSGDLKLRRVWINTNQAGNGGQGGACNLCIPIVNGPGPGGKGGAGGGVANFDGNLNVDAAVFWKNYAGTAGDSGEGCGCMAETFIDSCPNETILTYASDEPSGIGGGIFSRDGVFNLTNTVIAKNVSSGSGSGLWVKGMLSSMNHATIAQNSGGDGTGIYLASSDVLTSELSIINSILVSQTVGIYVENGSTAMLEATLWGDGAWANDTDWDGADTIDTTANLWGNPDFVNPDAGDYHIGPDSDAIDQGVDAGVTNDLDFQPRPNQTPDIGADEYWLLKFIYLPIITR